VIRIIATVAAVGFVVLVGTAAASGPTTVTVKQGTLQHGNAQSLNAVDGDTLDVASVPYGQEHDSVLYRASYGIHPAGPITIHHYGWETGTDVISCRYNIYANRTRVAWFNAYVYDTPRGEDEFSASLPTQAKLSVRVVCRPKGSTFTLHEDELLAID
jgi:hypothetical protein